VAKECLDLALRSEAPTYREGIYGGMTPADRTTVFGGGTPHPQYDHAERREQIRDYHAQGLNDSEIGRRLGVTGDAIGHTRKRMGLPSNYRPEGLSRGCINKKPA
jgi:hypothetical protein